MDALRTLNLLLDVMPEDLALPWLANASSGNSSFGERILEHCLSLLHVRSGSTNTGLRTDISTTVSPSSPGGNALQSNSNFVEQSSYIVNA